MNLREFQKDLKSGDIIQHRNNRNNIIYFKFLEFKKCDSQGERNPGCDICKGYYLVEELNNKEESSILCGGGGRAVDSLYEKVVFEEFIKEEEMRIK